MNWHDNRFDETFTYTKVSPVDWTEQGTYDFITTGSIEMSEDNKYKVTGSFNFEGAEKPDPNYYMRVYYTFKEFDEQEQTYISHTELLGTFLVTYSSLQYTETLDGMRYSGSINAYSVLKILDDKKYGEPFVLKRGVNPIFKAYELMKTLDMRVEYMPTSKVLTADRTFSADSSYLDIINWLCDFAKYRQVFVTNEGVACLAEEVQPDLDPDPLVFRNDGESIMYPQIDEENDWQERANVVKLIYNTNIAYAVATATNISGTKVSLDAVGGREHTLVEEISDVGHDMHGDPIEGNLSERLVIKAIEKLKEQATEEEHVTFSHAYVPITLGKAVKIEYSDMTWIGNAENISINLQPAIETQTKIKRKTEKEFVIEPHVEFKPR